jgi:hypothetical protein
MKNQTYWAVYRAPVPGDRGIGIAYRKDKFAIVGKPRSITIPHPSGRGRLEPVLILQRKSDKAKTAVIGVHLIAGGTSGYGTYQPKQQAAVRQEALKLNNAGETVIAGGDFNWYMDGAHSNNYMSPLIRTGDRSMRIFGMPNQKFSNLKIIPKGSITDHNLVVVNIQTTSFGK